MLSHSHPLMRDESFSSLPYLPCYNLVFLLNLPSKRRPFPEGTLQVGFYHNSCPFPFSSPLVLLPVTILSGLSSLPVFTWVVSFPQLSPTPQAHKPLCPCFTQVFTVFLASVCPCLSTFLLSSSAMISYMAHHICSFPWTPSLMPSSYFCANLSLQILMPFCKLLSSSPAFSGI